MSHVVLFVPYCTTEPGNENFLKVTELERVETEI